MKIADMIEYLFFSRGIYYLFQSKSYSVDRIPKFIELILRLSILEEATIQHSTKVRENERTDLVLSTTIKYLIKL